jgi:hypothetical protein
MTSLSLYRPPLQIIDQRRYVCFVRSAIWQSVTTGLIFEGLQNPEKLANGDS